MPALNAIPEYGVSVVSGEIGSGKSYVCVQWIIEQLSVHRRPVFTNMPLRLPVFRKYLRIKFGDEIANLLHTLTEEHFRSFIRRGSHYREYRDSLRTNARLNNCSISDREIEERYTLENGPHRLRDDPSDSSKKANWILPGSVVILDEFQIWFPQQSQKHEDPALQKYLTLSRHMLHKLVFVTQDPMLITIAVRRLTRYFWQVYNRGDQKLVAFIRFRHLGIHAFGYSCWTAQTLSLPPNHEQRKPIANFTIYPRLQPVIFRLYDSFTSTSSPHALIASIRKARVDAGLNPSGLTPSEQQAMALREKPSHKVARGFRRFVWRFVRRVVLVTLCVLIGYGLAYRSSDEREVIHAPDAPPSASLQVVTPQFVRIDGERIRPGMEWKGFTIYPISASSRVAMLIGPDGVSWSWTVGSSPVRLGTLDDLRNAESRLREQPGRFSGS